VFSMYGNHSMECTVWRGAADSGTDCAIPRHGRRVYDGSAARARSWGQGMCRAVAGKSTLSVLAPSGYAQTIITSSSDQKLEVR